MFKKKNSTGIIKNNKHQNVLYQRIWFFICFKLNRGVHTKRCTVSIFFKAVTVLARLKKQQNKKKQNMHNFAKGIVSAHQCNPIISKFSKNSRKVCSMEKVPVPFHNTKIPNVSSKLKLPHIQFETAISLKVFHKMYVLSKSHT